MQGFYYRVYVFICYSVDSVLPGRSSCIARAQLVHVCPALYVLGSSALGCRVQGRSGEGIGVGGGEIPGGAAGGRREWVGHLTHARSYIK